MIRLALAEIRRAPARTALRALAIGGAVSLTLLFEGFRLGIDRQMSTPASSLEAPLVVVEKGAKHFVAVRSDLPQSARAGVERVPGVRAAHPLVSVPVILDHKGRRTPLQVVAYDTVGAPRLREGHAITRPREVVLDARLAAAHRIRVGDDVKLLDRELRVAGLSLDTDVFFAPFAFVTYDELIDLYLESEVPGAMGGAPLLSVLLLDLDTDVDMMAVRKAIASGVEGVDAYTPAELAKLDVALGRQLFGPVINLLAGVGWIAVTLAVGLTMYAAVIDRHRDFGIMKALGARPGRLVSTVAIEALLVTFLAFPVALALARGAGSLVERLSPLYRVVPWDPSVIARGGAAAVVAALAGSLLPVRRLAALEPDIVFRA